MIVVSSGGAEGAQQPFMMQCDYNLLMLLHVSVTNMSLMSHPMRKGPLHVHNSIQPPCRRNSLGHLAQTVECEKLKQDPPGCVCQVACFLLCTRRGKATCVVLSFKAKHRQLVKRGDSLSLTGARYYYPEVEKESADCLPQPQSPFPS